MDTAEQALDQAFAPSEPPDDVLFYLPVTKHWIEQLVLSLVLTCHSSYLALFSQRNRSRPRRPPRGSGRPCRLRSGSDGPRRRRDRPAVPVPTRFGHRQTSCGPRRRGPRSPAPLLGTLSTPPRAATAVAHTSAAAGGLSPDGRSCTRRNSDAYGQLLARLTHTFRTVTRTSAPIFNSFTRIVWHCALAIFVPDSPGRCSASSSTYATDEKNNRVWSARIVPKLVRSANRWSCCSLIQFSIWPRPQSSSSYTARGSRRWQDSDVTTNRGLSPLGRCSAW